MTRNPLSKTNDMTLPPLVWVIALCKMLVVAEHIETIKHSNWQSPISVKPPQI